MKVLVTCPTYGRIPFLGRMLASFLSQDYSDKHLLIINDDKNVRLTCDYENVTCINLNKKILLGDKRNIAVNFQKCDLYMPHDDDDIFLPRRITNHVVKHIENPNISSYTNLKSYVVYGNEFIIAGNPPNAISFTRSAFFRAGGYEIDVLSGEDTEFYDKLTNKLIGDESSNIDYVYNFGGLNYHTTHTSESDIIKIAFDQLVELNLVGKEYNIIPDFEEYNKFVILDELYKKEGKNIIVKHEGLGKISIPYV